jgi:aminopeptidase N
MVERHDAQAVTIDDFISSMSDANGFDFTQFKHWYSQSGTPEVSISTQYDSNISTSSIRLIERECRSEVNSWSLNTVKPSFKLS